MFRRTASAILLVLLAAGCSHPVRGMAFDDEGRAAMPYDSPDRANTEDKNLRKVTPVSGAVLAAVPKATAVQVICQAIPKEEWARAFAGPVGRQVETRVLNEACNVSSDHVTLSFRPAYSNMRDFKPQGAPQDLTVAGRKVKSYLSDRAPYTGSFAFALTEDGEKPDAKPNAFRNDVIAVTVTSGPQAYYDKDIAFKRLIIRVLDKLVPVLTKDSPRLPAVDDKDVAQFTPTPPTPGGGIADAPIILQAMQLCTVAVQLTGLDPQVVKVEVQQTGRCVIQPQNSGAVVQMYIQPDAAGQATDVPPVAGHKASSRNGEPKHLQVQLREDVPCWLTFFMDNPREFAEKAVPLVLGAA